jgi:hypothetical protein
MPQTSSQPAPNFARLLAALTTSKTSRPSLPIDDPIDGLAPDIATLTYDRALRTHSRYRPAPNPYPAPNTLPDTAPATFSPKADPNPSAASPASDAGSAPSAAALSKLEQSRKRASITIRLTQSECAQLQQRAAEAGLTLSAYLRSCTIEVETLRAQVKQALAELRAARPANPHSHRRMFSRLFSTNH